MALRRTRVTSIPASIGLTLLAGLTAFALIAYVQWRAERSREAQISLSAMRADALQLRTLPWDAADSGRGESTRRALHALEDKVRAGLARLGSVPRQHARAV